MTDEKAFLKRLVILNKNEIIKLDESEIEKQIFIKKLKNPKSNELQMFLIVLKEEKVVIYELLRYDCGSNSVFIDNYIQSSSDIFMANAFNLKYFLLSHAYANSSEFFKVKDFKLLTKEEDSGENVNQINDLITETICSDETLDELFDTKGSKDKLQIKFNHDKCSKWVSSKTDKIEQYLKTIKKGDSCSRFEAFNLMACYLDSKLSESLKKDIKAEPIIELDSSSPKRSKSMMV